MAARTCAILLLLLGPPGSALAQVTAEDLREAESLRDPAYPYFCSFFYVARAIAEGRFTDAERLIRESHQLGQRMVRNEQRSALAIDGIFLYQVMQVLRARGELDRMPSQVDTFGQFQSRFTFPGPCIETLQATGWLHTGSETRAREEYERIAAKGFETIPRDEWWLPTLGGLAELARAFGDAEGARTLHALLLPYADRNLVHQLMRFYDGSVSRFLGLLAETFGDLDSAARHLAAATAQNDRMGARGHLAWTLLDRARVLLARGGADDRELAAELLQRCGALAEDCEIPRLAEQVARLGAGAA